MSKKRYRKNRRIYGGLLLRNNIMVGRTVLSAVNVNRYICCYCGFTEEWIDAADLKRVAESKKAKRS